MKKFILSVAGLSILALTGCVSQEQADAKMTKGCEGALAAQLGADKVKDAKGTGATTDVRADGAYRRINMTYVDNGSFDTSERLAECLFSEQWGAGKSSHTAVLEQIKINGTVYGKEGGVIQGSLEDFLKLTDASARAMGQ